MQVVWIFLRSEHHLENLYINLNSVFLLFNYLQFITSSLRAIVLEL